MDDLSYKKIDQSIRERKQLYSTNVALEMGGGQAGVYARFVLKAMEYFKGERNGG